jgi:hypothetical protein
MNLCAVELCLALIVDFVILVLKSSLPEASQSMHHSAENRIVDEIAQGRRLSGTLVSHTVILAECVIWL